MSLHDKLEAAGLTVRAEPGWETRTQSAGGHRDRPHTTSIVNHWDAIRGTPPNSYYVSGNRYGGLIYHVVIRRDGTVDLLGQRIAWNAGANASTAHNLLRQGQTPPPRPPILDDMTGNPYTFGVCVNYHPDFEAMTDEAYWSLVRANAVLCEHLGLSWRQVVDHAAVTRRKSDLSRGARWPGGTINMDSLRLHVQALLEPAPIPEPTPPTRRKRMYPLVNKSEYAATVSEAEVFAMIDAGLIGLIRDSIPQTKDYYRQVLARRNPNDADWDNLITVIVRNHYDLLD